MHSIPSKCSIVRLEIGTFKYNFTPPVEDAEHFYAVYTFPLRIKDIVSAIAVWCEGIWKEQITIVAKNMQV